MVTRSWVRLGALRSGQVGRKSGRKFDRPREPHRDEPHELRRGNAAAAAGSFQRLVLAGIHLDDHTPGLSGCELRPADVEVGDLRSAKPASAALNSASARSDRRFAIVAAEHQGLSPRRERRTLKGGHR